MISLQPHNISNICSFAHTTNEPFEDVIVVTAQSVFVDLAYQTAATLVYAEGHTLTKDVVHLVAATMIKDRKIAVQENVEVSDTGITVCINVDDINTDVVLTLALTRVADALATLDGHHGTVSYSNDIQFDLNQVAPLMVLSS